MKGIISDQHFKERINFIEVENNIIPKENITPFPQ